VFTAVLVIPVGKIKNKSFFNIFTNYILTVGTVPVPLTTLAFAMMRAFSVFVLVAGNKIPFLDFTKPDRCFLVQDYRITVDIICDQETKTSRAKPMKHVKKDY